MSIQNPLENQGLERIRMEEDDRYVWVYYAAKVENVVTKLTNENAELKAKLESVQASAYAESVDAGMRERKLKRALWLARATALKRLDVDKYIRKHMNSIFWQDGVRTFNEACYSMQVILLVQARKCYAKAEEYK